MARPNNGKEQRRLAYPRVRLHPNMFKLLKAFRLYLIQDGHPEMMDVCIADVSNEFATHYLNQTLGSTIMNKVKKNYSAIISH